MDEIQDQRGVEPDDQADPEPRKVRTDKRTMSLRCALTDPEKLKKAMELARAMGRIGSLEDDLTAAKSQYKSVIDREKALANELSETLRNGYEFRDVECAVDFDFDRGRVTTWRNDLGMVEDDRDMTDLERQRVIEFDQPAVT